MHKDSFRLEETIKEVEMNINKIFKLPKAVTIMGRSSSITNSFVNGIIPVIKPSEDEILFALKILNQKYDDVRCVYCGEKMTEWDHLYPLIMDKHSTGYITEIANLVPACGKCNQSKGNTNWKEWMLGNATLSPKNREIPDLNARIEIIDNYEKIFPKTKINLEEIVGPELWNEYWKQYDKILSEMKHAQSIMYRIKRNALESAVRKDNSKSENSTIVKQIQQENSDDKKLLRKIQTVGMETFVKYYDYFSSSSYSRQNIYSYIKQNENYEKTSLDTKVSVGLAIIRDGFGEQALKIISKAKRIEDELRKKALDLLSK
jgi:hypothetical protein